MARPYDPKIREFAYTVWRDCGQSVAEASRVLASEHKYCLPSQTLASWRNKYNWEKRAAQAEAEERLMAQKSSPSMMLLSLARQAQRYEAFLDELPAGSLPDPQVQYALNSVYTRMQSIRKQRDDEAEGQGIDRPRMFLEHLEFIVQTLKEIDPQGLKIMSRNFDKLIAKFKALETSGA